MPVRFRSEFHPDGVRVSLIERSLLGRSRVLPRSVWGKDAGHRAVVRILDAFIEDGAAIASDSEVMLPSSAAATLPPDIAEALDLPPLAPVGLAVALEDRVETPKGQLHLRWTDKTGQLLRPERVGMVLRWGDQSGRLSPALLRIAEAAERYNATTGGSFDCRVAAWLPVQAALKSATGTEIKRDGFLETFTLYQAGSFALDLHEGGEDFTPILMSRGKAQSIADNAPTVEIMGTGTPDPPTEPDRSDLRDAVADALLPPEDQRAFLQEMVRQSDGVRDAYRVGRNRFVLIDPQLKQALGVVVAKRKAPLDERRAFLRNPRAALADALGSDFEASPAQLFVETKSYSDRVAGLGLWERPKLPWLLRRPNTWLPEAGWIADGTPIDPAPLSTAELEQIERSIEAAEVRGDAHVAIRGVPIPIDAAPGVLAEERERARLADEGSKVGPTTAKEDEGKPAERLVLIITKTNFEGVEYELALTRRNTLIPHEPPVECLGSSPLKPHQVEGFRWLIGAWQAGWPGVLLADDMGLGKTYQALAFLAWLRRNAAVARKRGVGSIAGRPFLIVAPTALLKNWEKECADRLSDEGLGERLDAYGTALQRLKLDPSLRRDPGETLDVARLREADWILTTYETLTDHERAFARIPYPVVLFDEMQKVKAPDTLNSKAAKALNADFVIGLTGTPIENRMEDLWCLFDRIAPGYLGDLKSFSRTFREDAPDKLDELKRKLDQPVASAPPVMKRRMKADILEGLPEKTENRYNHPMPAEQASAYRQLIVEASRSADRSRGFMLRVLHGMRGISLHPQDPSKIDASSAANFENYARNSARLSITLSLLRDIAARQEKALIFIENLSMQDVIAEGIAAMFDLPRRPAIINGATPGEKRLAIVDAFERSGHGFGLLILSPKAAGVGLNIIAANHVIHLSRWWNPAVEDQCNDRVYRIGQTKSVTIHLPIATHPDFPDQAFDQELDRLLERKRQLSRHMLAPPTSEGDIETLFGRTVKR